MKTGIYIIRNTANAKVYVGSAVDIVRRWRRHRTLLAKGVHHARHLQAAWDLYSESQFEFVLIEAAQIADLLPREQAWIEYFHAADPDFGYNGAPTAGSQLGYRHTPEQKRAGAKGRTGLKRSVETRERMSRAQKGRSKTPEHAQKIGAGVRASWSPERRAAWGARQLGVPKGHGAAISAAQMGKPRPHRGRTRVEQEGENANG